MGQMERVLQELDKSGVDYELVQHAPAASVAGLAGLGLTDVCKNLFLRNAQGNRYYLVVVRGDKHPDLAAVREQLGCSRLSFASAKRLQSVLGVLPGAVTPLAALFDGARQVTVCFDRDLVGSKRLGFHPAVNTATVYLSYESVTAFVKRCGNPVLTLEVP